MGSDRSAGREYSLVELFAITFVLADVLIIAVLLFAGAPYAIGLTVAFLIGGLLWWALDKRLESDAAEADAAQSPSSDATAEPETAAAAASDPVTKLQERYAAGELSDAEFEAKLERLIDSNERADAADVETADLSLERTD